MAVIAIGSIAVTLLLAPAHTTFSEMARVLPWVGVGLVGGEIAWIGGAAMMLTALGGRVRNPFKIRVEFSRVAARAVNSRLFRLGFWTNTAGAIVQFVVPAVGVCWYLPYQLWGVLGIGVVDLAATVALRGAILTAMRRSRPVAGAA
ncbi:MAG TPA: hypothetical protein VFO77_11495 [Actinoplanes sp.]|nr:hypothetical protein [Actinoplanes sp.]